MESDSIYFARRAAQEHLAAMKAAHPTARRLHMELADRYADLTRSIDAMEPSSDFRRMEGTETG